MDPQIERVVGDLDNPASLLPALRGVEKIFLVTYQTRQDVNVIGAAKLREITLAFTRRG